MCIVCYCVEPLHFDAAPSPAQCLTISSVIKQTNDKTNNELKDHYERTINDIKQTNEKTNNELKEHYERTINEIKQTNDKTIKELQFQNEKLLNAFEKLATHAVDRPTTSTVNNHNNIRNNFSDKYFIDTLKNEDIKKPQLWNKLYINHLIFRLLLC